MNTSEKRDLIARTDLTLNGQRAIVSGALGPFALVRSLERPISATYAWETVRNVVANHAGRIGRSTVAYWRTRQN